MTPDGLKYLQYAILGVLNSAPLLQQLLGRKQICSSKRKFWRFIWDDNASHTHLLIVILTK